jgi:hypothetical protein
MQDRKKQKMEIEKHRYAHTHNLIPMEQKMRDDPLTYFLSVSMSEPVKVEVKVPKAIVEVVKGLICPQFQNESLDDFWHDLIIRAVASDIEFLCRRIGNPTTKEIMEKYPGLKEALGTHHTPIVK